MGVSEVDSESKIIKAAPEDENFEEVRDVDIAYQILIEAGRENPIHFKKWILEIINRKNGNAQEDAAAISEIYTLINMDSRFQHIGDGFWSLADWYPPEIKRSRTSTKTTKASS